MDNVKLIGCASHKELAGAIADRLNIPLAKTETKYFANGETRVCINESVRGFDLFIVGTGFAGGGHSLNDAVMELFFMLCTCKRSGSKSITLLLPHYFYARQDKKDNARAPISSRDVANLLTMAGVDRIVCLDLHNPAIQGFFDQPCDNLYGSIVLKPFLNELLFSKDPEYKNHYVAVAPDEGGFRRSNKYARLFGLPFVSMSKTRDYTKENVVEKSIINGDASVLSGRTAIVFDDMCDTAGTVISSAKVLRENGCRDVIVIVTHGLLSGPGLERIRDSPDISTFICSDSVPQTGRVEQCSKIKVFTIAPLYAEVVKRMATRQSISELFE